jgi:hypothetical protein
VSRNLHSISLDSQGRVLAYAALEARRGEASQKINALFWATRFIRISLPGKGHLGLPKSTHCETAYVLGFRSGKYTYGGTTLGRDIPGEE